MMMMCVGLRVVVVCVLSRVCRLVLFFEVRILMFMRLDC